MTLFEYSDVLLHDCGPARTARDLPASSRCGAQPSPPEYQDRDARIARLDEQGVEQAWLIPTLGLGTEELLRVDPESAAAVFRAYNRWLEDDWGYDRDGRLLTGPMISLIDPAAAEAEVDRVLAIGTRMVVMRAGPVSCPHERPLSPADPRHDRVWARLAAFAGEDGRVGAGSAVLRGAGSRAC
jgi:hypothetical protein